MKKDENMITRALSSRESLLEIVAIALILTFGLNLASSNVVDYWGAGSQWIGIGGWLLVLAPITFLLTRLKKSLSSSTTVSATVPLDIKENKVIEVPGYVFSEKLNLVLNAAFVENEAFKMSWRKNPLVIENTVTPFPSPRGDSDIRVDASPINYSAVYETAVNDSTNIESQKLLTEAVEYILIESISDQLDNYFGAFHDSESRLIKVTGNDVPDVLLKNRLLLLFTTPLQDRAIYTKVNLPTPPANAVLRSISGSDGSLFTTLRLHLPSDSSIVRPDPGVLEIMSDRVNIKFSIKYEGEQDDSPQYFKELYLGKHPSKITFLKVSIRLDVKIKLRALFRMDGWRYYKWADDLSKNIYDGFDFSGYVSRINWNQIRAQARVNTIALRLEQRANKAPGSTAS